MIHNVGRILWGICKILTGKMLWGYAKVHLYCPPYIHYDSDGHYSESSCDEESDDTNQSVDEENNHDSISEQSSSDSEMLSEGLNRASFATKCQSNTTKLSKLN